MFKFPRDLDAVRAIVEADPEIWAEENEAQWATTHEYLELEENWLPMPPGILEKLPNAEFLETRDHELAKEHPQVPVADILEALRHFRILDKFYTPDTLFWDQVFHTERTLSALRIFQEARGSYLDVYSDEHFLTKLIYRNEVGEYLIEGNVYQLGYWQLSLPWSVIATGVVPAGLCSFGEQLNHDAIHPKSYNSYRRGSLELKIHDCPTSNPWLLPQTHHFLLQMADKWGWYIALDEKHADLYAFYATCVDPARVNDEGYQRHPLDLAAAETSRLGLSLQRLHEQHDRPEELARKFEEALNEELEFPAAEAE
ncbi:hypothetical protein [Corynebacterium sp. A21]|uniref:hypothetical protein n=1 Tax=Corynebacterium sp. A21 TaxID=3457318 RepID=UPI003FD256CF